MPPVCPTTLSVSLVRAAERVDVRLQRRRVQNDVVRLTPDLGVDQPSKSALEVRIALGAEHPDTHDDVSHVGRADAVLAVDDLLVQRAEGLRRRPWREGKELGY